jgi:hypothetical protein
MTVGDFEVNSFIRINYFLAIMFQLLTIAFIVKISKTL